MSYLLLVSIIWAFSFGLIKTNLAGVHPLLVTLLRLLIASLVFLPFFRRRSVPPGALLPLLGIGALEFGCMYIFYNLSFQQLKAHEVALFTIFTPFLVALTHWVLERRGQARYLLTALLAVAGTAVIKYTEVGRAGILAGFLLVQLSNLCFAVGQVLYRRLMARHPGVTDRDIFALPYLGGTLLAGLVALLGVDWQAVTITPAQWGNLLYLGALASGLGFFLWNMGARRTNIGALAIFNNLKIPLAMVVSLVFFGERTPLLPLLAGGALVLFALILNERWAQTGEGAASQPG